MAIELASTLEETVVGRLMRENGQIEGLESKDDKPKMQYRDLGLVRFKDVKPPNPHSYLVKDLIPREAPAG